MGGPQEGDGPGRVEDMSLISLGIVRDRKRLYI